MTLIFNPSDLGGGFNGIAPRQTNNSIRDYSNIIDRRTVRSSWDGQAAYGTINSHSRIITPFRAVNNSGDFLARQNYTCGGFAPSTTNMPSGIGRMLDRARSNCDGTGVPGGSCNPKFVADSSDYTRYRRQRAVNQTYNLAK